MHEKQKPLLTIQKWRELEGKELESSALRSLIIVNLVWVIILANATGSINVSIINRPGHASWHQVIDRSDTIFMYRHLPKLTLVPKGLSPQDPYLGVEISLERTGWLGRRIGKAV